jgi:hypothetical protein
MDSDNPLIVDQSSFEELCDHIRQAGIVAFDSEFVSEYTYRRNFACCSSRHPNGVPRSIRSRYGNSAVSGG